MGCSSLARRYNQDLIFHLLPHHATIMSQSSATIMSQSSESTVLIAEQAQVLSETIEPRTADPNDDSKLSFMLRRKIAS